MAKQSSTVDITGIDIDAYRRWIEYQFTPKLNWNFVQIDHVRPISSFDVSNNEELKEAFNWKNTPPLKKRSSTKRN